MNTPAKQPRYVGVPDGPEKFVPEFGCKVKTFKQPPGGNRPALTYHVPPEFRGDFRPRDLANFNKNKEYRTDAIGKVLCYGYTQSGERCSHRAVNRSPRCNVHGGRLHPLDKLVRDEETANGARERESLSRYRQFVAGQIGVDALDDEELAACGFRASDGRIYKPRNVPRELAQAFTRAIYERAQQELRTHTVNAAKTVAEVMMNQSNDPGIRLKAAELLIERNLGKTPQVVAITNQAPWEEIFDDISGGSRQLARQANPGIIEAEVIDEPESDDFEADTKRRNTTEDVRRSVAGDANDQLTQYNSIVESRSGEVINFDNSDLEDSGSQAYGLRDARLYERNEAIIAQTVEIEDFYYDLSKDVRQSISVPEDVTLKRIETPMPGGLTRIRYTLPKTEDDAIQE